VADDHPLGECDDERVDDGSGRSSTVPTADVHVTAASFESLKTMTPVRGSSSPTCSATCRARSPWRARTHSGVYPTGTLLQLVPQEAMVKHRPGWNPATDDWEFFALDVSATGTTIATRGIQNVVNRFGGNCASCHMAAKGTFDFVCEHNHGCAPLPVSDAVIRAIQLADPVRLPSAASRDGQRCGRCMGGPDEVGTRRATITW